jgi:hypothetical protein
MTPGPSSVSRPGGGHGEVRIEADNTVQVVSVAGAAAIAGGLGIGGAPDVVVIDDGAEASIGDGASVQAAGNVVVTADNRQDVLSLAGSLAIGDKSLGVSGAGVIQIVTMTSRPDRGWRDGPDQPHVWSMPTTRRGCWACPAAGGAGRPSGFGEPALAVVDRDVTASIATTRW